MAVEERLADRGPARRMDDRKHDERDEDDGARKRDEHAPQPSALDARENPSAARVCGYLKVGTLVFVESHSRCMLASVPADLRSASALFTHWVNALPFANTIPKCSGVPTVAN